MRASLVCLLGLLAALAALVQEARGQVGSFSAAISDIVDTDLGFGRFQEYVSTLPTTNGTFDPELFADFLVQVMEADMNARAERLEELAEEIRQAYLAPPSSDSGLEQECCLADTSMQFEDPRFTGGPVDKTRMCHRLALEAVASNPSVRRDIRIAHKLLDSARQNLEDLPTLKWQYFGSTTGAFGIYPSRAVEDCAEFDPRFRPWFSGSTTVPKHVVLLVDTSGSMSAQVGYGGLTSMDLARMAAHTMLDSLDSRDKVTVVGFSDVLVKLTDPEQPCFSDRMIRGTPDNLAKLHEFVDSLRPSGGTNFQLPFDWAYRTIKATLAEETPTAEEPPIAIVFLTDGSDDGDRYTNILSLVRNHANSMGSRRPHIFSYSMGDVFSGQPARKAAVSQFLGTLASEHDGAFIDVGVNYAQLRTSVASAYYEHPSFVPPASRRDLIHWTVPYLDATGLGLVVTAARAVYNAAGDLLGVAGMDLTLADLFSGVPVDSQGSQHRGYLFIVDAGGRAVMHPLMRAPSSWKEAPNFVPITQLETSPEFAEQVLPGLLEGASGSRSLVVSLTVPRGGDGEGAEFVPRLSSYSYRPIPGTPFRMCLVLPADTVYDLDADLFQRPPLEQAPASVYHRAIDLSWTELDEPVATLCSHFGGNLASAQVTGVQLPVGAFANPQAFLDLEESAEFAGWITQSVLNGDFESYPNNASWPQPAALRRVWMDAAITALLEPAWIANAESNLSGDYIVWRYVAALDTGLLRVYPGHPLTKTYDARERAWFKRALAFPGLTTLGPPYVDAFGAGVVITISRAVTLHLENSDASGPVYAVMGADLTLDRMWSLLDHSTAQECSSLESNTACYVVDSSGYLVLHPSFVQGSGSADEVQGRWLGDLEPALAASLVSRGAIKQTQCNDYERRKVQSFRSIPANTTVQGTVSGGCGATFVMRPIRDTNAFLIVVSGITGPCRGDELCACCELCQSGGLACFPPAGCNCPCECRFAYDACQDKFADNGFPACPVPPVDVPPEVFPPPGWALPCVDSRGACASVSDEAECWERFQCQTCLWDGSGNYLAPGSRECRNRGLCPPPPNSHEQLFDNTWQGVCRAVPSERRDTGGSNPGGGNTGGGGGGDDSDDSGGSAVAIGGGVAGGVVALICLCGFILPCLKGRSDSQNRGSGGPVGGREAVESPAAMVAMTRSRRQQAPVEAENHGVQQQYQPRDRRGSFSERPASFQPQLQPQSLYGLPQQQPQPQPVYVVPQPQQQQSHQPVYGGVPQTQPVYPAHTASTPHPDFDQPPPSYHQSVGVVGPALDLPPAYNPQAAGAAAGEM